MVQLLSESAPADAPRIESSPVASGGKTLKLHWEAGAGEGAPRARIAEGGWDRIVIQEIYSAPRDQFDTYAALFDDAIRAAGSQTVLFATANVSRCYNAQYTYPESFKALNDMQIDFGQVRGIPVAAAGYAWMRYLGPDASEDALLDLYHEDRGHPGLKGSYIYACLLYAVLTGCSPVGLTSEQIGKNSEGIAPNEARVMQRAAWDEYCCFYGDVVQS
jgi:hypothetical protein